MDIKKFLKMMTKDIKVDLKQINPKENEKTV